MRSVLGLSLMFLSAATATAQDLILPSGQTVTLADIIFEEDGALARFRFLAPRIGADLTFPDVAGDFPWLCEQAILPALAVAEAVPERVVISMADRPVEFGEITPDAIQFFEAFSLSGGVCIWEEF